MTPSYQLEFITAPNLPVPHGFSTRTGGVSEGPFATLNLGLSTGDDPNRVEENRRRFLAAFSVRQEQVCALSQIHSDRVVKACPSLFEMQADASVTDDPDLLLVISGADCFPLLFHDPRRAVVGAAHCGWRGTLGGMATRVVTFMKEHYGSQAADLQVAIGPGIQSCCYEVGQEVAERFLEAGFNAEPEGGRYRLDLAKANCLQLVDSGVLARHIWDARLCTHCEEARFFSYRRDKGKTGRLWAAVRLT